MQQSIREPNKSTSSTGVGMYSKDYSTLNNTGNATKTAASSLGPKSSVNQGNNSAQSNTNTNSQTLNKSLESVIRKAAYKGIEPLRRRYTAAT